MGWGKTGPAHSFPPPPLGSNLSIYLSVLGLNYSYTEYEHLWLTYLKEKFKLQSFSQMILLNRGWGKTCPAHSFPPLLFSNLSIFLSVFRFNLLLQCIWTLIIVLSLGEIQVKKAFNHMFPLNSRVGKLSLLSYKFIGTSTLWGGERLGRPILSPPPPPSIMLGSFNLLFSLSVYVTLWLYLNNFEWPIPKRDQVVKPTRLLVLLRCGVGKDWAGPFFPPLQNVLIYIFIFQSFKLCCSFIAS